MKCLMKGGKKIVSSVLQDEIEILILLLVECYSIENTYGSESHHRVYVCTDRVMLKCCK